MGGGGGQTQTQRSEPWAGQQPYLTDLFRQGQGMYQSGIGQQFFPGQTVAPFSPQTQLGLDAMTQRALGGSPVEQGMQDWITGTFQQPQIGLGGAAQGAGQYLGQIGAGQQALLGAAQPMGLDAASQFAGGAVAPWQSALGGMTQFGGLGEAQQFAGTPQAGALPASQQAAERLMQQGVDPQAAATLGQTAGGGFLGSNPYLDQVAGDISQQATQAFTEDIAPAIAAQFGGAGRARRGAAGVSGAGIQGDVLGRAGEETMRNLQSQLASDVYMPAYEAERGRQQQAAMGLGELGLGAGGLQAQAAGLGGDLFSRMNQAELGRLGLASQQYLGERGLGQQAAQAGGQLGLGAGQLGADLYGQGMDRMLQAGLGLQQGGLGGIGALGDLYGQQQSALGRAGALAPTAAGFDYQNIDRLMQAGALTEDQAQRLIDAERERFDFYQQAPWQALGQYGNLIYGLPGGYGTTTQRGPSGSRAAGALGGALSGAAAGSVVPGIGTLAGGILGGLGGLFG